MSKRKALMELLVVTFNKKDTQEVLDLIKKYSSLSLTFQSFGSLDNMESVWNFDIVEKCSLAAIIPVAKTKDILIQLETCLNLKERHQGIAFTVPFSSCMQLLTEKLKNGGVEKWKQ